VDDDDAHPFIVTTLPKEVHVGASTYITVTAKDLNDRSLGLVQGPVTLSARTMMTMLPCPARGVFDCWIHRLGRGSAFVRLMATGDDAAQNHRPERQQRGRAFRCGARPCVQCLARRRGAAVPLQHKTTRTLRLANPGRHELELVR